MRLFLRHSILLGMVLLGIVSLHARSGEKMVELETVFRVNKWEILPNEHFRFQLDSIVIPVLSNPAWEISRIEIHGAASPEGPWAWNCTLAKNRKEALLNHINLFLPENRQISQEMMQHVIEIPEDYDRLLNNMLRDNDPYSNIVFSIIDSCASDPFKIKSTLQNAYGGLLWKYLIREYFPALRSARLLIYLSPATPLIGENTFNLPRLDSIPNLYLDWSRELGRINRKELLSIKTNLLLDFAYVYNYGMAYILNVQAEYYPKHGHFTPVLSFDGPWWQYEQKQHKYFQVRNYQAEVRWYIRKEDARYDGFYLGVYGHGMLYGVGFNKDVGYQGEGWGVGLSGGYVLPLIRNYKHIKLEFGLQVGYFSTRYDPYVYGCPVEKVEDGLYYYNYTGKADKFVERQYSWMWIGPTRVGITFTYDLMYRKHNRKGASFIWHEPYKASYKSTVIAK